MPIQPLTWEDVKVGDIIDVQSQVGIRKENTLVTQIYKNFVNVRPELGKTITLDKEDWIVTKIR
jgi:hypothetical protein